KPDFKQFVIWLAQAPIATQLSHPRDLAYCAVDRRVSSVMHVRLRKGEISQRGRLESCNHATQKPIVGFVWTPNRGALHIHKVPVSKIRTSRLFSGRRLPKLRRWANGSRNVGYRQRDEAAVAVHLIVLNLTYADVVK